MNEDLFTGTIGNMCIAYKDIITHRTIDEDALWSNNASMQELRDYIAKEATTQMDLQVLEQLKEAIKAPKEKTKEERVIDIAKGGFENHFGMSLDEFHVLYDNIVDKNPEKLI